MTPPKQMPTPTQTQPDTGYPSIALRNIQKTLPLRVISPEEWRHWTDWGYVIVRNAVPAENVRRLADLLWEFQEMDPADPSGWYKAQAREHAMKELNNTGMVEIYQHQYLWDNRQHQRVYDAFVDIWDTEKLWCTIDRANLNPPNRHARAIDGFIHWDADTSLRPLPVGVQGVLSLCEQCGDVGGFQCVPELFNKLEQWIGTQVAGRDPFFPDLTGFAIRAVDMNAGDLLIFNSLLPHGIRPNLSTNGVRLAQYIAMYPADKENQAERQARIRGWRRRQAPQRAAFPGDPRDWERKFGKTARLTALGKRLLGLQTWNY